MKTKCINLYSFNELSETAKQSAIESLHNINADHNWWDFVYMEAENIGLKIKSFDIDKYCNGYFIFGPYDCAASIIKEHGKESETYKTAKEFTDACKVANEDNLEDLEETFLSSLLDAYRIILRNEFAYLTSKEAIIEAIISNEYYFTEDGKLESL